MTIELPEPARFYYADDDHRAVRKPLPLYTAAQMLAMRDAALEEAVMVCQSIALSPSNVILGVAIECRDAIRALKTPLQQHTDLYQSREEK